MSETLMTETATTTTEGQTASQSAASDPTQGQPPAAGETAAQEQQATDGQTQADAQAGDDTGKADGDKGDDGKAGAPEQYEFKAVEGAEISPESLTEFSQVAKELNLPQEAAQKILDKMAPALAARQAEAIEAVQAEWATNARTDKEFGGDKLTESLSTAKKALDTFGTPELRTLLNESGLGNHPEVIRVLYRAGKAISEDGMVQGTRANASQSDPAKRLFPNQA
jgi:hypothetical protein